MSDAPVAVLAWSLFLPGVDLAVALPELAAAEPERAAAPACPPERARELLGRKGLLNKDPATRLALCAVHRALGHPPGRAWDGAVPDPRTAVVASSNLGNVAAVAGIVEAVRSGGRRAVSPVAAPNASSNVLASAVACWFGFGGPNLMLCSGTTAGLDAVATAALLLRSGRADRVVVVGAEPADELAAALHRETAGGGPPLRAGAACVILGRPPSSLRPPVALLGPVGAPVTAPAPGDTAFTVGAGRAIDLAARCGDLYGALGVAQVAAAAAIGRPARLVCGDDVDGWRTVDVHPAAACSTPAGLG